VLEGSRTPLERAGPADAHAIAMLLSAAAAQLTAEYGAGHWSRPSTERGILVAMRTSHVYIMRQGDRPAATLALAAKKPWAVDLACFTPSRRAVYLQSMAVAPGLQRHGIGRSCVEQALQIARDWRAETVRLDAYDADAGAGGFYLACGFRQAGRIVYRSVPLVYFERML
jgi:GNAT superfamily N-acetyltransferase